MIDGGEADAVIDSDIGEFYEEIVPVDAILAGRAAPRPHGNKLEALLNNHKLPSTDRTRVASWRGVYEDWLRQLLGIASEAISRSEKLAAFVNCLTLYRNRLDLELVFDSPNDFLYRQSGQLKLGASVLEEFLPRLLVGVLGETLKGRGLALGPTKAFAGVYFQGTVNDANLAISMQLRAKDQDMAIARRVYLKASDTQEFQHVTNYEMSLAFIAAECKTNLDKTMFQEAVATAHDVRTVVPSAKYFLLCEWLDMTPVSSAPTDIAEVLLLRKARRLGSHVRKSFATAQGRKENRDAFSAHLLAHPYAVDVFERFLSAIDAILDNRTILEEDVLKDGFF